MARMGPAAVDTAVVVMCKLREGGRRRGVATSTLPPHGLHGFFRRQGDSMSVKRMDNVGIVVEDIDAAIEFFTELGLALEGRAPIEGNWADGVTGLRNMRVEIAMMRTPDGHSR